MKHTMMLLTKNIGVEDGHFQDYIFRPASYLVQLFASIGAHVANDVVNSASTGQYVAHLVNGI
jgi:hypothetical protein